MARKKGGEKPTDMLTISEAARLLGVGPSAIIKAIQRGRLAATTIIMKPVLRISRADLYTYMRSRTKGGRPRKAPQ
jgi:excisionase family DNA binding protein